MRVELYVADYIEPLASGKLAVMGLFPDRRLILNVDHDAPEPSDSIPYAVNLALCISMTGLEAGEHEVGICIEDPSGRRSPEVESTRRKFSVATERSSANAIVQLQPLLASALGTFSVVCSIAGVEHRTTFEVQHRRLAAPQDLPLAEP